jgi:hypothetical protein
MHSSTTAWGSQMKLGPVKLYGGGWRLALESGLDERANPVAAPSSRGRLTEQTDGCGLAIVPTRSID